jgi:hypothetical protein
VQCAEVEVAQSRDLDLNRIPVRLERTGFHAGTTINPPGAWARRDTSASDQTPTRPSVSLMSLAV